VARLGATDEPSTPRADSHPGAGHRPAIARSDPSRPSSTPTAAGPALRCLLLSGSVPMRSVRAGLPGRAARHVPDPRTGCWRPRRAAVASPEGGGRSGPPASPSKQISQPRVGASTSAVRLASGSATGRLR
jgi:hypothetical protein